MVKESIIGSKWQHQNGCEYEIVVIAQQGEIPKTAISLGNFCKWNSYGWDINVFLTLYEIPINDENSDFVFSGGEFGLFVFYRNQTGGHFCRSVDNFLSNRPGTRHPRFVRIDKRTDCNIDHSQSA